MISEEIPQNLFLQTFIKPYSAILVIREISGLKLQTVCQ